jgi:hypothetical protein
MKRTIILLSLLAASSAFANDIDPFGFEKQPFVGTKSRTEVAADAKQAMAADQISRGEFVHVEPTKSVKSRAQVVAETREAARLGLLTSRGDAGLPEATPEQERQIRLAGERANGKTAAAD